MTPDWDAKPISVPYASFGDPQTLNLYSYVENAPLNRVDADGHAGTNSNALNLAASGNPYVEDYELRIGAPGYAPETASSPAEMNYLAALQETYAQTDAQQAQQQVSQQGQDFIKGYEQLRLAPYDANPPHGDMTIGYGHKIKSGESFGTISKAEAEKLFSTDVSMMASHVSSDLKVGVTQNQFDALVSLRFNAGPYAITPPVSDLNSTGHATMADFTQHYITAGGVFRQGLANRRSAEWNIFSKGIYDSTH
jgi:GH24 family phage-related lysozyme (muramidase)